MIYSIPTKLVVWAMFQRYGPGGATIGEIARVLRSSELVSGTTSQVRRFVRRIVADWEKSRGRTHRELERVSSGRYRAVFNDRELRIETMPVRQRRAR